MCDGNRRISTFQIHQQNALPTVTWSIFYLYRWNQLAFFRIFSCRIPSAIYYYILFALSNIGTAFQSICIFILSRNANNLENFDQAIFCCWFSISGVKITQLEIHFILSEKYKLWLSMQYSRRKIINNNNK